MAQNKIAVLINYKDRPSELSHLLLSLRNQTIKDFDVYILDDFSGTPIQTYHFMNCILTRMRIESFKVFYKRTDFPHGVSKARQAIVEWANPENYEYFLRVDDDVILEPNYIEELFEVIQKGYHLASGVTIAMNFPSFKRESKFLNGVGNRVVLDEEGNYIWNGDDCGMEYVDKAILPIHHFRSCALYQTEIHKAGVNYTPNRLTKHGFREEQLFSYKIQMAGFKMGFNTKAVNWHQMTPSGGERFAESNELIKINEAVLKEFTKENKEKLREIFKSDWFPSETERLKETNLANKI